MSGFFLCVYEHAAVEISETIGIFPHAQPIGQFGAMESRDD